uniref:Uncharacterized protein n=1 Tax=Arundo donax TaxID=35708 RepID=A0A0A9FYE6_ARUDO
MLAAMLPRSIWSRKATGLS